MTAQELQRLATVQALRADEANRQAAHAAHSTDRQWYRELADIADYRYRQYHTAAAQQARRAQATW